MTGSGSPCGACKFLKRKCVRGCVFAPYFYHEQAALFSAIHKVFGASNVSKLLGHLPVSDRCEAAVTIAYEAQARLQDPIYGCVSHIFALQQQVVNLQAQLASLKEQAAQSLLNGSSAGNLNEKFYEKLPSYQQDFQSWFQLENSDTVPQFDPNLSGNSETMPYYSQTGFVDPSLMENYTNSMFPEENISLANFEEASSSSATASRLAETTNEVIELRGTVGVLMDRIDRLEDFISRRLPADPQAPSADRPHSPPS